MSSSRKTAIVTGASQGIGAGIVKEFVERGFNVVANSRKMTQSTEVAASDHVALVDGHIGKPATAVRIVETALSRFKSIEIHPFHVKVPEAALVDLWRRVDGKTYTPNLTCERIEHDERRELPEPRDWQWRWRKAAGLGTRQEGPKDCCGRTIDGRRLLSKRGLPAKQERHL